MKLRVDYNCLFNINYEALYDHVSPYISEVKIKYKLRRPLRSVIVHSCCSKNSNQEKLCQIIVICCSSMSNNLYVDLLTETDSIADFIKAGLHPSF